jgi:hypothetical protein
MVSLVHINSIINKPVSKSFTIVSESDHVTRFVVVHSVVIKQILICTEVQKPFKKFEIILLRTRITFAVIRKTTLVQILRVVSLGDCDTQICIKISLFKI